MLSENMKDRLSKINILIHRMIEYLRNTHPSSGKEVIDRRPLLQVRVVKLKINLDTQNTINSKIWRFTLVTWINIRNKDNLRSKEKKKN